MSTFDSRVVGLIEMKPLLSPADTSSCCAAAGDTSLAQWFEQQQRPRRPEPQPVSAHAEDSLRPIDRFARLAGRAEETLPPARLAASVPTLVTADLRCLATELNLETCRLVRRLQVVSLSERYASGAGDV